MESPSTVCTSRWLAPLRFRGYAVPEWSRPPRWRRARINGPALTPRRCAAWEHLAPGSWSLYASPLFVVRSGVGGVCCLRGRPPFAPLARAAATFASDLALPPSRPRAWAALFISRRFKSVLPLDGINGLIQFKLAETAQELFVAFGKHFGGRLVLGAARPKEVFERTRGLAFIGDPIDESDCCIHDSGIISQALGLFKRFFEKSFERECFLGGGGAELHCVGGEIDSRHNLEARGANSVINKQEFV